MTVNAFWIGRRLGAKSRACLRSFLTHGHPVNLHVYEEPEDAPAGVTLCEAEKIMPRSLVTRHRETGSYALASDRFRYELMAADVGAYVDCDCYCVRPVQAREYMFGWESDGVVASAVLAMPPDSPLLASLRKVFAGAGFIPPWFPRHRRRRLGWRRLLGRPVKLENMPWGTAGPRALTYYAKFHGLAGRAQPAEVYYPVHFDRMRLLLDPGVTLDSLVTSRTEIVHLWNELLPVSQLSAAPAGLPLARIIAEGEG